MDTAELRRIAKESLVRSRKDKKVENLEFTSEPLLTDEDVHFDLDLVPVTEDLRSFVVSKKKDRISGFTNGKEEKRAELSKKLELNTISPGDLANDGWLVMWMKYYRLAYDTKYKGIVNDEYKPELDRRKRNYSFNGPEKRRRIT